MLVQADKRWFLLLLLSPCKPLIIGVCELSEKINADCAVISPMSCLSSRLVLALPTLSSVLAAGSHEHAAKWHWLMPMLPWPARPD